MRSPWERFPLRLVARPVLRLRAHLEVRRALRGSDRPVLVLQMGRVGSMTLLAGLRRLLPERRLLHVHWVSAGGLDAYANGPMARGHLGRHYWTGRALRHQLGSDPEVDVVTLVRDPVARNLSHFHQTLELWRPGIHREVERRPTPELAAELQELFLKAYPHDQPLTWFDTELHGVLGVDVYEHEPPSERGFTVIEAGGVRVLILRLEDLAAVGGVAVERVFDRPDLRLDPVNQARQGDLADVYGALTSLPVPAEYLDRMYGSRYARHFYRQDEREAFRSRWRGGAEA